VSIHAEGERVILTGPTGTRQEIDLAAAGTSADRTSPTPQAHASPAQETSLPAPICPAAVIASGIPDEAEPAPGTSPLDEGLRQIAESVDAQGGDA
jgi:hypothetical protein